MRAIGVFLRNLFVFAACAATAGNIVIPAGYALVTGIVAEQSGQPLPAPTSTPFSAGALALGLLIAGLAVIVTGGLLVRFTSLWTIGSVVMGFAAIQLLHMNNAISFLPAPFRAAWNTHSGLMPWWGWLVTAGVAFLLFLVSWPFGKAEAVPVQEEEPRPAPRRTATGS